MLKPEIKFGDNVITLPCALKCIENAVIDEESIIEFPHDGIDAIGVTIYCNGNMAASVSLDNRDKDLPIMEKTIVEISLYNYAEFYGIRTYNTKWEDACAISGSLDFVKYGNFLAPLENGYYFECLKNWDEGTVGQMEIRTYFDNAADMEHALSEMIKVAKRP